MMILKHLLFQKLSEVTQGNVNLFLYLLYSIPQRVKVKDLEIYLHKQLQLGRKEKRG